MTSRRHVLLLALLPLLALLAACSSGSAATPKTDNGQCSYTAEDQAARKVELPPGNPDKGAPQQVTIATDRGEVKIALDADKAPCTVNSFLSLAKQGYFDKTTCHRLTSGGLFVLQCGDPTATGAGGPGYSFKDELVKQDPRLQPCLGQADPQTGKEYCTYPSGTVAMANDGPDSNGSQFFLVYGNSVLPAAYTVFGHMDAAGLKVVRTVAKAGVVAGTEKPRETVTITSVK